MALYQNLKIWAKSLTPDPEKGNTQRRIIKDEEFESGMLKGESFSAHIINQMFFLFSSHSTPHPNCVFLLKDGITVPDTLLKMDGSVIIESEAPVLHALYGGTLPDLTSQNITGHVWVIRKQ